jgi:hypothetical protein
MADCGHEYDDASGLEIPKACSTKLCPTCQPNGWCTEASGLHKEDWGVLEMSKHKHDGIKLKQDEHKPDEIKIKQDAFLLEISKHKHVHLHKKYNGPGTIMTTLKQACKGKKFDLLLREAYSITVGEGWSFCGENGARRGPWHKLILHEHANFIPYAPRSASEVTPMIVEVVGCCHCKKPDGKMLRCAGCMIAQYCSTACRESAWSSHKSVCRPPNEADQMIEVLWDLAGMHFAYGEYFTAKIAADKIIALSTSSMRWGRIGQQKRLLHLLEPYLSQGVVPQRGTRE